MIECNFKEKAENIFGQKTEMIYCRIKRQSLVPIGYDGTMCDSEQRCIIYQMYRKIEESDL